LLYLPTIAGWSFNHWIDGNRNEFAGGETVNLGTYGSVVTNASGIAECEQFFVENAWLIGL